MTEKKIFPIRTIRTMPRAYKTVEWKLHNVCNYDCSFCGDENKIGNEKWHDISVYKNVVKKLMAQAEKENKFIWFQLTGGEPTLYPKLFELLSYIKENGHRVSMISNGSRTIRYWKELAEKQILDLLHLTHHTEQDKDENHSIEIANLFHSTTTEVRVQVTAPIQFFDEAVRRQNQIIEQTGAISSLKPIFYYTNGSFSPRELARYSEEQTRALLNNISKVGKFRSTKIMAKLPMGANHGTPMTIEYSDGVRRIYSVYELVDRKLNCYTGWECSIGIDLITIQHELIYRGVCRMGGIIGNINDEDFGFVSDGVMCKAKWCSCLMDIQESKFDPRPLID
jgi:organic radical activating enzyme